MIDGDVWDSTSQRHYNYMGGCQNYGPFLGTRNIRCRLNNFDIHPYGGSIGLYKRYIGIVEKKMKL